ncbi:hypothetical protein [Streptomyces lydicus]|uniref:hypothetical protein n=1 Tax=Streptomyces lydicus TaxID=47763 RepID=UPI001012A847|nr:hypothetical protein [Streptomyces lydicus]MCZ1012125.1 hypothetical protein [Streptomyces lydicus]
MNQYGRRALRHWQEFRSGSIAQLDDPEAFFIQLGVDAQDEVGARWRAERLTVPAVVGESYFERAGGLQPMRYEAEEQWRERGPHKLPADRSWPQHLTASVSARLRSADSPRRQELPHPGVTFVRRGGEHV